MPGRKFTPGTHVHPCRFRGARHTILPVDVREPVTRRRRVIVSFAWHSGLKQVYNLRQLFGAHFIATNFALFLKFIFLTCQFIGEGSKAVSKNYYYLEFYYFQLAWRWSIEFNIKRRLSSLYNYFWNSINCHESLLHATWALRRYHRDISETQVWKSNRVTYEVCK